LACSACGGATPAPKDADEAPAAAEHKKADEKGTDDSASAEPSAPAPAPAASETPPAAPAPAPAAKGTDLTAAADDVWMASHQMPPKDVLKTMRPQQGKVHACFSAGHKRDPSISGEVKVKFVVTNDGAVRAWKDDGSSMTDADVTKCIGDLVQKSKFPKQKSPGDAWATYSANFSR
jgi:hypothetical protein